VYVPLAAPVKSSGGSTKVEVLRFNDDERVLVPAFTSERTFKNWCFEYGHNDASFTLLGGDLCAVLEDGTWLRIDQCDPHMVELAPSQVRKVAESGLLEKQDEEAPGEMSAGSETPPSENARPMAVNA